MIQENKKTKTVQDIELENRALIQDIRNSCDVLDGKKTIEQHSRVSGLDALLKDMFGGGLGLGFGL